MKSQEAPLTTDDKLAAVKKLSSKFHRYGELLLPDDEIYPERYNQINLEKAGKKICVWLGIKPNDLDFSIGTATGLTTDENRKLITIDDRYSTFYGAALLAKSCVEYLLHKKHLPTDSETIEIATIELGLGLLILNTAGMDSHWRAKLNRIFGISKPKIPNGILHYFSLQEYSRKTISYVNKHQLNHNVIWEHTLPSSRIILAEISPKNDSYINEPFVVSAQKQIQEMRIKIGGVFILSTMILIFGVALYSNQPKKLSPDLQNQKELIEVLLIAHEKCQESLKIMDYNSDGNDLFAIRQLDAHASRCNSIKNKHDHYVRLYNQKLAEQDLL